MTPKRHSLILERKRCNKFIDKISDKGERE